MDFSSLLKFFSVSLLSIIILDIFWVVLVMSRFYKSRLGSHARTVGGIFRPNMTSVMVIYLLLALGFMLFVLPNIFEYGSAFLWGAAFGLVIYGVYELMNRAVLVDWPITLFTLDLAWGTVLCGIVGWLLSVVAPHIV